MEIITLCPFRATAQLWQNKAEQFTLTVLVKATFALVHEGEARIAAQQEPLSGDRHHDERPLASLYAPSDFAPMKGGVDVTFVGHAYAPGGGTTESLVATLRVGETSKSVAVAGDRTWVAEGGSLVASPIAPFARMPMRYERAALTSDNPVGIDAAAPPFLGGLARPNLAAVEPTQAPGFGPIAPTWRARRSLVDDDGLFWVYGASSEGAVPPGPAPASLDFGFFNAAPAEQQLALVRPGADLELENLHPRHAIFRTTLPAVRPQVFHVDPWTGRGEEIVLRCDSLWIDGDRDVLVLSFRGVAEATSNSAADVGRLVVVADPHGKRLRFDRVAKMLEHGADSYAPSTDLTVDAEPTVADPLGMRHDSVKGAIGPDGPSHPSPLSDAETLLRSPMAESRPVLASAPVPAPTRLSQAGDAPRAAAPATVVVAPTSLDPPADGTQRLLGLTPRALRPEATQKASAWSQGRPAMRPGTPAPLGPPPTLLAAPPAPPRPHRSTLVSPEASNAAPPNRIAADEEPTQVAVADKRHAPSPPPTDDLDEDTATPIDDDKTIGR